MKSTPVDEKLISQVVIAGCGYLGKKVIKALVKQDIIKAEKIISLVKTEQSRNFCLEQGVEMYCFDFDQSDWVLPDIIKTSNTLVYYFMPPPRQGKVDSRVQKFIAQLQQKQSYSAAKIVLISTTGVYGNCHGQWVDENYPVNPQIDRAFRRVDAEQQFQSYCRSGNIPLVILRVSGIYGPGKLPIKRIKAHTPIVRRDDSPYSNRIHSDDLVEICVKAGLSRDISGIFNCADGHPTTMYDYFMKIAQANQLPEPPSISIAEARKQLSAGMLSYMDESRRISNKKLLSAFKLQLKYPQLNMENLKEVV